MSFLSNLVGAWRFLLANVDRFLELLGQHLALVLISEVLAILVAVPLGVLALRNERAKGYILGAGNVAQTVPTLAIIALVFPLLGIGFLPALVGLFAYAILPILTNTITGLEDVSEDTVEAARGMGMTENEILKRIQFPLALPVIFAGIRTSAVINVGTAYLAFFIGGGGLGVWVISGINLFQMEKVLAGAIPGALLAIAMDTLFALVEQKLGGEGGVAQQVATG
ncbi:ABC transporter permease [Salinigranum sp.]|jgi:osmoprotectant transport system permease protein|uniref:ABC transporter permease n=1 Tax=Salinigranum sp. TaxID=1966351 RepID=UPI0035614C59